MIKSLLFPVRRLFWAAALMGLSGLNPATAGYAVYWGEFCWEKVERGDTGLPDMLKIGVLHYGAGHFPVDGTIEIAGEDTLADLATGTAAYVDGSLELMLQVSRLGRLPVTSVMHAVLDSESLDGYYVEQIHDFTSEGSIPTLVSGFLTAAPCSYPPGGSNPDEPEVPAPSTAEVLYSDDVMANVVWIGEGTDPAPEATASTVTEVTTSAFEGEKSYLFDYVLENWWAGFGLTSEAGTGWNIGGYNYLRVAFKGIGEGHKVTVKLGYESADDAVTLAELTTSESWTSIDIPIPAEAPDDVRSLGFIAGGAISGSGQFWVDSIKLIP